MADIDFAALVEAARAGPTHLVAAATPWLADPNAVVAAVDHLMLHDGARQSATVLLLALPAERRERALLALSSDPRDDVRAGAFAMFAPARLDVPNTLSFPIGDAGANDMLARGVADPHPPVREAAIAAAFATSRGHAIERALIDLASVPALRWSCLLALGSGVTDESLALLRIACAHDDAANAGAAIRALAERPEGAADVVAAVADPRPDVRRSALFAIAHVLPQLSRSDEAALTADGQPDDVRAAVDAFRARQG